MKKLTITVSDQTANELKRITKEYHIPIGEVVDRLALSAAPTDPQYAFLGAIEQIIISVSGLNEEGVTKVLPIFELLASYPIWTKSGLIDKPALMNAIWQDFPEYAVIANGLEQSGANDIVGGLLNEMGADAERNVLPEHLISISPDVGTSFLRFPADVQHHQ